MGAIISLLLGGFAQNNLGALAAGQNLTYALRAEDGFAATFNVVELANRYGGLDTEIKPEIGLRKGMFSFSLGYLFSPFSQGDVRGIPVTADVSAVFKPINSLIIRPRVSLLGPARFYAADPYETYATYFTAGGGADLICDPFLWKIKPVMAIGATAGYTFGRLISDIAGHEEPLEGFGAAANAALAVIYDASWWGLSLEGRVSYGGRLVPEFSISFIW